MFLNSWLICERCRRSYWWKTRLEKLPVDFRIYQSFAYPPTFGWSFITFHGSPPVYYGRTKEAFRVTKPSLDESRKDNSCCFSSNINCIETQTNGCCIMPSTFLGPFKLYLFMYGND